MTAVIWCCVFNLFFSLVCQAYALSGTFTVTFLLNVYYRFYSCRVLTFLSLFSILFKTVLHLWYGAYDPMNTWSRLHVDRVCSFCITACAVLGWIVSRLKCIRITDPKISSYVKWDVLASNDFECFIYRSSCVWLNNGLMI